MKFGWSPLDIRACRMGELYRLFNLTWTGGD